MFAPRSSRRFPWRRCCRENCACFRGITLVASRSLRGSY